MLAIWTNNTGNATGKSMIRVAMVIALTASVSACANSKMTTGSINKTGSAGQQMAIAIGDTRSLGEAYAARPSDKSIALGYANALQNDGNATQALAVVRKLAIEYPKDREVLAAYGKALASSGQLEPALDAVRRAQTPEYPDWRLMSAEASIVDQLGNREQARDLYRRALDIQPNEPSVLSNLAMSYVMEGNLKVAEGYLETAVRQPGADSRVRQNLALVVGLQGRFNEAEQIASQDISPEQAKANVTYLRRMLSQQNAWGQLKDKEKNTN
ncbi:MAG: tetratricopeptide repeat protein [Rhizobiaceae bacterium]|nr:tetratricopeptide repeat protein [Rhizobiaceae bacterium]